MRAVVFTFLAVILAFYLAGLKEWSVFFMMVFAALGLGELYALRKTGITLSENFYNLTKKNKLLAILLTLLLGSAIGVIIYHLWTMWG